MVEINEPAVAKLLTEIWDVFGQNMGVYVNGEVARGDLTHGLNESWIGLHDVATMLTSAVLFTRIIGFETR